MNVTGDSICNPSSRQRQVTLESSSCCRLGVFDELLVMMFGDDLMEYHGRRKDQIKDCCEVMSHVVMLKEEGERQHVIRV